MKAFRLLAISLLVALSMGVSSCGDDELDMKPVVNLTPNESSKTDELFDEYVSDNHRITCRGYADFESTILFAGLKDKHLWFAEYEKTETKGIRFEWTDIEETDTIQKVYKGYGEYETIYIRTTLPIYYKKTSTGNIVTFMFNSSGKAQTIFTYNNKSRRTQLGYNQTPNDWYSESVFIRDCCYSYEGDIIYVANQPPQFDGHGMPVDTEPISYEEGIKLSDSFISKYNFKEGKSMWVTHIAAPFDVPSDARKSYTFIGSTANIWEYKCEVTFYDGAKKDFTFKINIDNGKIVTDEVKVTSISINEHSVNLKQGETFQLIATVQPDNATNKKVIWSSSNETIASVSQDGLVTVNSAGEANITVTTEDGGFSTNAIVTVTKKQDDYTSLIIGKWKMTSGNANATHVTYKNDGTFEYTSTEDNSYKEVGKYKIDGNKLYEMFSDEEDWTINDILLLNSMTLSVQELEADGVILTGHKYSYQRVE